jgi:hypothetical protein
MTCKTYFWAAALTLAFASIANTSFADNKKKSYDRSVFSIYNSLPVNKDAAARTRKTVSSLFPSWAISTDKLNGSPTDIYGKPIALPGATNTERARSCMQQQLSALHLDAGEWKQVSVLNAPKADYVNYTQVVSGHPVVFSKLSFRFTHAGELARIQLKNYGTPAGNKLPAISRSEAKTKALEDLSDVVVKNAAIDATWAWFPIPTAGGYTLHPAWHFTISGRSSGSSIPLQLTGYIDGTDGSLLYRTNDVKETGYDITIKGTVYKNGTLQPATTEPLTDLKLTLGSAVGYTDTGGHYVSTTLPLPLSTTIPLEGKWSTVIDDATSLTPSFVDPVSTPGTVYSYPVTAPSSSRHVNAYYHVNKVHNFMKQYFPSFILMDFSLPTNVDLTSGYCNAYYSGHDINFFAAGGGCNSFAELGDVIYHEYGHGISDHFYTLVNGYSIYNDALNEANSDIWGLSITHDPVLARNAFTTGGGFIRRYDITPQVYPIDLDLTSTYPDPHKNGMIIAGCWWDLGVNVGSVDTMTKLFTDVYYDAPDGPNGTEGEVYQKVLISALMADDDNNDLLDGTPHYAAIVGAFAKHGIYLEGDAIITHDELSIQGAGNPITVSANLNISDATYFHDLTLLYRINGTGPYTPLVLTNSSWLFTGSIPAQPAGTVIDYFFVMHDALNVANGYFPITCNPSLPDYQATIPYQTGVGMHSVVTNDFSTAVTGWSVGRNVGDDASAGIWQRGIWSLGDHSTGSGQCVSTSASSTSYTVSKGTTTVITPVFDISTYTNPVIEYYRYFTNETSSKNFKNDPWIVKIKDASASTWTDVERTYQADDTWRRRIFRVSSFIPGTPSSIQLKFFASDSIQSTWASNGQSKTSCGLDDFAIYDMGYTAAVSTAPFVRAQLYPVPANEQLTIFLPDPQAGNIALYDLYGKKVAETAQSSSTNNYTLNTAGITPGSYNVVITSPSSIQSRQVTIMH